LNFLGDPVYSATCNGEELNMVSDWW